MFSYVVFGISQSVIHQHDVEVMRAQASYVDDLEREREAESCMKSTCGGDDVIGQIVRNLGLQYPPN